MATTRVIKYNDLQSTLALWLKVFTLAPFWFYPVVPLIGFVLAFFGWYLGQIGYTVILLWSAAYFIEDLLKRKLTLRDETLFFGYKSFALADIEAAGLKYGKNKVLPSHLVLRFTRGRQLRLKLNRLSIADMDFLIRHIETNYKSCKIDPVVQSLSVLRTVAKKNLTATSDRLEIPYASHRPVKEMISTFVSTAAGWTRFGPALCIPIFGAWGMHMLGYFYKAFMNPQLYSSRQLEIQQFLQNISSAIGSQLSQSATSISTEFVKILANPIYGMISFVGIVSILYYFFLVLLKPNNLVVTPQGIDKNLTVGPVTLTLERMSWSDVVHASLKVAGQKSGDSTKLISLERANEKPFELRLNSLEAEDRQLLNQRIKKYAPDATHDENFDEAMLTRQKSSYTELWLQSLATPPKRASIKPLSAGEILRAGQFEVIGRLGLGGQGTAYLCFENGKKVVLKETILPTFVDSTARQHALSRFEQEARLLNEMDHRQIVKLTDYFIEDHRSYLVLEHIDGNNLKEVIGMKGPMSEESVRELALQMCDMLEYLHDLNVVHRDFTPDNLMLTQNGLLKLIDFNVAKNEEVGITATVVGKHAYIPPEQFRGKPIHQSDLYAMGATLSYLLTGIEPTPITPSEPQNQNAAVTDDLNSLIKQLTQLSSDKRPSSIKEVRKRLLAESPDIETKEEGFQQDLLKEKEESNRGSKLDMEDLNEESEHALMGEKLSLKKEAEPIAMESSRDG